MIFSRLSLCVVERRKERRERRRRRSWLFKLTKKFVRIWYSSHDVISILKILPLERLMGCGSRICCCQNRKTRRYVERERKLFDFLLLIFLNTVFERETETSLSWFFERESSWMPWGQLFFPPLFLCAFHFLLSQSAFEIIRWDINTRTDWRSDDDLKKKHYKPRPFRLSPVPWDDFFPGGKSKKGKGHLLEKESQQLFWRDNHWPRACKTWVDIMSFKAFSPKEKAATQSLSVSTKLLRSKRKKCFELKLVVLIPLVLEITPFVFLPFPLLSLDDIIKVWSTRVWWWSERWRRFSFLLSLSHFFLLFSSCVCFPFLSSFSTTATTKYGTWAKIAAKKKEKARAWLSLLNDITAGN